jgi:hypothetical protein
MFRYSTTKGVLLAKQILKNPNFNVYYLSFTSNSKSNPQYLPLQVSVSNQVITDLTNKAFEPPATESQAAYGAIQPRVNLGVDGNYDITLVSSSLHPVFCQSHTLISLSFAVFFIRHLSLHLFVPIFLTFYVLILFCLLSL